MELNTHSIQLYKYKLRWNTGCDNLIKNNIKCSLRRHKLLLALTMEREIPDRSSLVSCLSGDRALQTSCCGNLPLEPVCRPSALHRILVCSVRRPAVLVHNIGQRLLGSPSGNHVLPAHKVCWDYTCSSFYFCSWHFDKFCVHLLNSAVSLNAVPRRTLCWVWPLSCPILLLGCSTYASFTWEVMQRFRTRMSCTGEMLSRVFYCKSHFLAF